VLRCASLVSLMLILAACGSASSSVQVARSHSSTSAARTRASAPVHDPSKRLASRVFPHCSPGRLHYRLSNGGNATTSLIVLTLTNRGPTCSISGTVRLTIEQNRAPTTAIRGNPAAQHLHGQRLGHRAMLLVRFEWLNWCGARHGFTSIATYRSITRETRFTFYTPVCLQPKMRSSLISDTA